MKVGWLRAVWAGMGVLAVAGILLTVGQRDSSTNPDSDSYSPSGARVFSELLRGQGYRVSVDKSSSPKLSPGDLAIVFVKPDPEAVGGGSASPQHDEIFDRLKARIQSGANALVLPIPNDFGAASSDAFAGGDTLLAPSWSAQSFRTTLNIRVPPSADGELLVNGTSTTLWSNGRNPGARGIRIGKGTSILVASGLIATNRFIDRAQNADFLMTLVSALAKPGQRVVFAQATFEGAEDPGLFETIGPWASAAWQQVLVLALVIGFTLGKRLGLPDEERRRQRGEREFVDAMGDSMKRTRSPHLAMRVSLDRADAEIRLALKIPKDAPRQKRDDLLSDGLRRSLANLEAAIAEPETPAWDALRRVQKVDAELNSFLGARRRRLRKVATIIP